MPSVFMYAFQFKIWNQLIFKKNQPEYYVNARYPNVIISAFLQSVKQYVELAIPKGGKDIGIMRVVSSFVAVQLRSSLFRDGVLYGLVSLTNVSEQRIGPIFKEPSR